MQTAAGVACVAIGFLHFVDRDRPPEAVRSYYLGSIIPKTPVVRAALAVVEVTFGFTLLFTR